MSKRKAEDPDKADAASRSKLRGLEWNTSAAKPAFLRNAAAALSGNQQQRNRPAVPERPDADGAPSDEDEWDLGRGDEAPEVVVLKEGKHLDKDQVDELRKQAKESNETDPLAPVPEKEKTKASLSFATGDTKQRKRKGAADEHDSKNWDDLVKRAKAGTEESEPKTATEPPKEDKAKAKKKEKKKQKQQIGLLSFDE